MFNFCNGRTTLSALLLLIGRQAIGQITSSTAMTPAQVVQNVLLGPGVTATNITFLGDPNQLGTFNCVNCNVGIPQGMVMCTGDVAQIAGPNNSGGTTLGGGNFGIGDVDLDVISAPFTTNDRAVLEFDFVPTGDSIKFNFVFGSEEYLEWVAANFNDVFGFFLSGPGITGPYTNSAVNIALIPGTTLPVTIDNVNDVTNAAFYVNNGDGWTAPQNGNPFYIQYDGFTTVMQARAQVICGETYHIKLAIADVLDASFDSGVFIEAGSFQSNLIDLTSNILSGGVDSVLFEGCGETELIFTRAGDLSDSLAVNLFHSGTAINGVDHTLIPPVVYFVPGQSTIVIPVQIYLDALTEPLEQVNILATYQNQCTTGQTDITFYISDAPPILLSLSNDTTVNCNDSTLVVAQVSGGYGTLFLDWNTGIPDGQSSGWVNPPATTTYILTVTDDCGVVTVTDQVTITIPIPDPLVLEALPDTVVFCPESPVTLSTIVTGGTPGYTYLWSNGLGTAPSVQVAPPTTQAYTVQVTDLCGLTVMDEVTVTVDYDTVSVTISPDTVICNGDAIDLTATATLGWGGYSYLWDNGATTDVRNVAPSTYSTYSITVTDGCGISATDQSWVGVNAPDAAFTYTSSVYVQNLPVQFIDLSVGASQWSWDFGEPGLVSTQQSPVVSFEGDGLFTVMLAIMDGLGCVDTAYADIFINPEFMFYAPNAFTPDGNGDNDVFRGSGVGISTYEMRIYNRWGELIHETEELYGGWDGTTPGGQAPNGVYVYWFKLRSIAGRSFEYRGHVTLVR
ncbi:MAG: choice-of-anchor L domain-containing protein [Flavobacteriales bacterium]|nr:choice-of-anchor L domain-containing protein [Flavobacteriales bacterium]